MGAGEKTCFWGSPVPVPGQGWRCSGEMWCGAFLMELLPTAASSRKKPLRGASEMCSRTFVLLGIGEGSFPTASLSEGRHGGPPWHSCTGFPGIWVCQWGMGVWRHGRAWAPAWHTQHSQPYSREMFLSATPGETGWGGDNLSSWVWIADWCRAEVSFLTSRLNLRFNLYFCSELVFPVLLAKWSALMLALARRSHEMKCCPSQTSPAVPFSKGIFEKGLWAGTFKCWV